MVLLSGDVFLTARTFQSKRYMIDVLKQRLKMQSGCAHDTTTMYRSYIRLHAVERRRFPDAHMPRSLMLFLDDVTCHWLTSHAILTFDFPA